MHTPVLLHEVIRLLDPKEGEFFIDGTVDGGGHGAEIFQKISPDGTLLGVDLDREMTVKAEGKISANAKIPACAEASAGRKSQKSKLILHHGNYADLPQILEIKKLPKADGLLLDLGFSSNQLESDKGFSFEKDQPLLMTYDASSTPVSELLRELSEQELADVIFKFGGERFSRRIAKAIKTREKQKPIRTTGELAEIIRHSVPKSYEHGRIDPATRTFQALRIYANNELPNLEQVLDRLPEILKPGARVAIISFHSLEDRIVKTKFKQMEHAKILEILTKKPIRPDPEEIRANPRSRSAMLRAGKLTH